MLVPLDENNEPLITMPLSWNCMNLVAPSMKLPANDGLEKCFWDAVDRFEPITGERETSIGLGAAKILQT